MNKINGNYLSKILSKTKVLKQNFIILNLSKNLILMLHFKEFYRHYRLVHNTDVQKIKILLEKIESYFFQLNRV